MRKITGDTIVDFSPYEEGFVFSTSDLLESGSHKVSFYSFDAVTESIEPLITPVNKKHYSILKFGFKGDYIANQLGNNAEFFLNDCSRMNDGHLVALDDNGNFSLFDPNGELIRKAKLVYRNHSVCSPAAYKDSLWCAVPDLNTIINYSIENGKIHLRVIGLGKTTFCYPQSITIVGNKLYVCNRDSGTIRLINFDDGFTITDYYSFKEPVYKYIQVNGKDFALLESGIYEFNEK